MTILKRIKYVSEFVDHQTGIDIANLVKQAEENNRRDKITGILIASGRMFFQVIEGPIEAIDRLYANIVKDRRHKNVLLLNAECGVERIFPDWALKRVDLNNDSLTQMEPMKALLETIVENRKRIEKMTGVLERSIWERFSGYV
jgi:adenylate cyclase